MSFTVTDISSVKKQVAFEIPAEQVDAEIEKVYQAVSKNASIKGFRKGKVPRSVVEKQYADRIAEEAVRGLVGNTCYKAFQESNIIPVTSPVIDFDGELEKGKAFAYTATVEVFPEVEVKDYAGLELKKESFIADEQAVQDRLKTMQENMSQLQPAPERAVESGDFVTLDFTGYVDGEAFESGAAQDYVLEIGSKRFIPGFEDQVVGMKAGETGRITVKFPEEYGNAELAGKDAEFEITIKDIKVKELPELNDDFAKEVAGIDTLEELQAKIRETLEQQERERIDGDLKDRVVAALIERNPIEVPESMVDKQLEFMLDNMKRRLASQRLSMEMMGMTEDKFREMYRSAAEGQVKGMLLLDAVGRKEGVKAEDADVEARIERVAQDMGQDVERLKNFYQHNREARGNLLAQIREEKTLEFLLGKAVITEVSREELTSQA